MRAPHLSASHGVVGALGVAVLVAVALLSPRALPYNMDEFVHYHALGCASAPLSEDLPSFRDGCGLYDLRLPFTRTWLPLRSYYYIGSLPAVPFYPLWLLLQDPVAVRVQGALFFVVFVLLATRLLGARPGAVVLASLVFPVFAVAFLVDQGPVGISVLLLLAALLAVRRSLVAPATPRALAWAALAGFVCFLGLWVKLVFAWWLPAVALFALAEGRPNAGGIAASLRRQRGALLASALTLLVPTLVLLASVDVDGRSYASALSRGRLSAAPTHLGAGAQRLSAYLLDASLLAPRNVALPSSVLDVLPAVLSVLILAGGLWRSETRGETGKWLLLGLVTFGVASTSAFTQWPHHFVFPALFLVLALARCLDRAGGMARAAVVVAVVCVWASLGLRWPSATYPRDSSPEKDELLSLVREEGLDRDTLQVHSSWGTYYIAQLFGDRERMAVFVKGIPDDPVQLREVACLARQHARPVLLVSSRRWSRIQTTVVDEILGRPDRTWRFGDWWAVTYGTEGVEGCGSSASSDGRGPVASTMQPASRSAISSLPSGVGWMPPRRR